MVWAMVKSAFWVAVGAAAALQVEKWMDIQKRRFSTSAVTGSVLEKINQTLENKRQPV